MFFGQIYMYDFDASVAYVFAVIFICMCSGCDLCVDDMAHMECDCKS